MENAPLDQRIVDFLSRSEQSPDKDACKSNAYIYVRRGSGLDKDWLDCPNTDLGAVSAEIDTHETCRKCGKKNIYAGIYEMLEPDRHSIYDFRVCLDCGHLFEKWFDDVT